MLTIKKFIFSPFQVNTYVLYDETKECIIIDAACIEATEEKEITEFISSNSLKPVKILNTHGHLDHIFGNNYLKNKYKCDILGHAADDIVVANAKVYGAHYGIDFPEPPAFSFHINDNDTIKFGNSVLKVIHTPGHTQGGVSFYIENDSVLFSGDSLFYGSIGRTDLPGGNFETLINSIKKKLLVLPKNTIVYSGHGPSTSIENETKGNPFL